MLRGMNSTYQNAQHHCMLILNKPFFGIHLVRDMSSRASEPQGEGTSAKVSRAADWRMDVDLAILVDIGVTEEHAHGERQTPSSR